MKIDYDCIPPTHKALIDTGPIRALLGAYRRVRATDMLPQDFARRLKRNFKALTQTFLKVEGFNIRVRLKCEMLKTDDWKARVISELGGDVALERWEVRKAASNTTILAPRFRNYNGASQRDETLAPKTDPAPRELIRIPGVDDPDLYKTTRCQTDQDGLFRLAPIKPNIREPRLCEYWQAREAKDKHRADTPPKPYKRTQAYSEIFHPIPLTPDELRGDMTHNLHPEDGSSSDEPWTRRTGIMATERAGPRDEACIEYQATLAELRKGGHFMGPSPLTRAHLREAARIRGPDS